MKEIILQFIRAINSGDADRVAEWLSEDHVFIDSLGNQMTGKETIRSGWEKYFEWFPDYRIDITEIIEGDDVLAIFGFAGGTYKKISGKEWRVPAAWKVRVSEGKVSFWQVFADTAVQTSFFREAADH